jgi:hypothetical protein
VVVVVVWGGSFLEELRERAAALQHTYRLEAKLNDVALPVHAVATAHLNELVEFQGAISVDVVNLEN